MSRTPRPINLDKVTIALFQLIMLHKDRPCPTRREIMAQTGLPRRRIWPKLGMLADRGLIEIEMLDPDPTRPEMPRRYRMRVTNGPWTGWTRRRRDEKQRLMLDAAGIIGGGAP